jgi:rSAM/selenodomain-associated transferase 1
MNQSSTNHLIIFCKNPVLGRCKTRLAASIGPEKALAVYQFLLSHTAKVTSKVSAKRIVFYSHEPIDDDDFDPRYFNKDVQEGDDLGERMANALRKSFANGAKKVIIIGSDLYDISSELIEQGFEALDTHQTVIGPAKDGGYYLIGMNGTNPEVFKGKNWGTSSVLQDTLSNLNPDLTFLLDEKNDIDQLEDLHPEEIFKPLIS